MRHPYEKSRPAKSRTRMKPKSSSRCAPGALFAEVNAVALPMLESLCHRWLPDGRRVNREFVARNPTRADKTPGSFRINLNRGLWADFATGDKGGDPISLYAYLNGLRQIEAAHRLADELGGN